MKRAAGLALVFLIKFLNLFGSWILQSLVTMFQSGADFKTITFDSQHINSIKVHIKEVKRRIFLKLFAMQCKFDPLIILLFLHGAFED